MIATVKWDDGDVVMIDQRRLPQEEVYLRCRTHTEVATAIREMAIRGAPAIGVAAALGIALGIAYSSATGPELLREFDQICEDLKATRPTAANLFWAIDRMGVCFKQVAGQELPVIQRILREEALNIHAEDLTACRRIGDFGAELLPHGVRLLTHCNAGALATAGYGTALGVIRSAARQGKVRLVFVDETRPYLQGARLTAWELSQDQIPTTLIIDSTAGYLMARKEVDAVIVGADRIAANGDVANKIGTYSLAVLAHENHIPFYVAAPLSTFDFRTATGADVPIEERPTEEITHHAGQRLAPRGIQVFNPAFDITPHRYITAIISEQGVAHPPYTESLLEMIGRQGGGTCVS